MSSAVPPVQIVTVPEGVVAAAGSALTVTMAEEDETHPSALVTV